MNISLTDENVEFKQEIKEVKQEIKEVRQEIKELKQEFANIKALNFLPKLIIAIQDVNASERLESILPSSLSNILTDIRSDRTQGAHYFITEGRHPDSTEILNYKKQVIIRQLDNLTSEVKSLFEDCYEIEVLDAIRTYLNNQVGQISVQLSQSDKRRADSW